MTPKLKSALTITLTVILALWMLMAGLGKLMVSDEIISSFHRWALPRWLIVPVGIVEVAAAISLFIPRLRRFALAGIVLIMAGAMVTHVRVEEYTLLLAPLMVVVLVILITIFRYQLAKAEENESV